MKKIYVLALIFIVLVALVSIIIFLNHNEKNNSTQNSQLPNPASVYCEEQGYELEIRTNPDGSQTGYCIFLDGTECEEWSYFCGCTTDNRYCGKEYLKCNYECK